MKSFNALGLALAATIAAAGFAAPASAQYWQGNGSHQAQGARHGQADTGHLWKEIAELDRKIDRADKRNTISEREANGLHRQVAELKRDYRRYSANGLDRAEARQLAQRTDRIEQRLKNERRDRDGRRG